MRKRKMKRGLAYLLCAALMFESSGISVLAEEAQTVVGKNVIVSEMEVLAGTGDATDTVVSGTYEGMNWVIDENGLLIISGEYNKTGSTSISYPWAEYAENVTCAKIIATGVEKTDYWFSGMSNLESIDMSGFDTSKVQSMGSMFNGCSSLTSIDMRGLDTQNVTDMSAMFCGCSNLTALDLSELDTGNVTNMNHMFSGCSKLTTLDLSTFETSKVQKMMCMFLDCNSLISLNVSGWKNDCVVDMKHMFEGCSSLVSLNLDGFQTSQVTEMDSMFSWCSSLNALELSRFDTSHVTSMDVMFYGCESLGSLDLSNFNTQNVTEMSMMFANCEELESLNLSGFDMSQVTDAGGMFQSCSKLNTIQTPKKLALDVELCGIYVDSEGIMYNNLPKNRAESIVLTKDESIVGGVYCGLEWFLSSDGLLTISGEYAYDKYAGETPSWIYYDDDGKIVSAKITATAVTSTANWFFGCENLQSVDLSEFDMSQVTNATEMFKNATALKTIKTPKKLAISIALAGVYKDEQQVVYTTLPTHLEDSIVLWRDESVIGAGKYYGMDWVVDKEGVLTISGQYDGSSEGVFWGNVAESIENAKVSATGVESTSKWFYNLYNLSSVDLSEFDTSKVTDMSAMFYSCSNLNKLDVSGFDTGLVTNMRWMFGYSGIHNPDVSNFDTSHVIDMKGMFSHCMNVDALNVSNFDTSCVTDMANMFDYCEGLENLDVSNFDTSCVTDMKGMFRNCSDLGTLDVSGFDTEQVEDTSNMFYGCSGLTDLDVSKFNTSKVVDMNNMFYGCYNLTSLDVSGFDTRQATETHYMFASCSKLTALDMSGFDLTNAIANSMLDNCTALKTTKTPKNLGSRVDLPITMYDESGNTYTELPMNRTTSITLTATAPSGGNGGNIDTNDGKDEEDSADTNDGRDENDVNTNDGGDKKEESDTDDGEDEKVNVAGFVISSIPNQSYTGKAIKPAVTVKHDGKVLVAGKDYTVTYKNNINVANANSTKAPTVIIQGKGNYTGTMNVFFNIVVKELTAENTDISEMFAYENGSVQTVKPVVKFNGKKLQENKDYTIQYPDKDKNVEGAYKTPGTYNVVIKGTGNYDGDIPVTMTILSEKQVAASKLKIGKIAPCKFETGKTVTPKAPKVTYKGKELTIHKDYAITYEGLDRAGKATMILTGLKNTAEDGTYVVGTVKKTFTITGTALKKAKVEYDKTPTYTGSEICPEVKLSINGTDLVPDRDYTVEYTKNINAGKATIILTGQGGYTGTVKKTFTILADSSVESKVAVSFANGKAEASYNAKGAKPEVKVMLGEKELVLGKDYTLSYKNNKKLAAKDAAKAPTIVIKGKGNYKFTKTETFAIVEKSLADNDISVVSADKFIDSKKGYLSAPVIKDGNGKKLKVNKDYVIVGYTVNGEPFNGTGEITADTVVTVEVEGKNNYTGKTTATYRIAKNDISKTKVNKPQLEYTGGATVFTEEILTQEKAILVLTDKNLGKDLVYGTDYIITGYKNNTKKGTATVTIQGIGEYGGTKNVKFKIVSKNLK